MRDDSDDDDEGSERLGFYFPWIYTDATSIVT